MGAERAALKELAELFHAFATLYAVGGFSRSLLLGVPLKMSKGCFQTLVLP